MCRPVEEMLFKVNSGNTTVKVVTLSTFLVSKKEINKTTLSVEDGRTVKVEPKFNIGIPLTATKTRTFLI